MGDVVELFGDPEMSTEATKYFDALFEKTNVFQQLGLTVHQMFMFQRLCWRLYDNQPLVANAADLVTERGAVWYGMKKSTASDALTLLVDLQLLVGPIVNKRTKARRIEVNIPILRKLSKQSNQAEWVQKLRTQVVKRAPVGGQTGSSKRRNSALNNTPKQQGVGEDGALVASAAPEGADAARRGPLPRAPESKFQDSEVLKKVFSSWEQLDRTEFVAFLDEHAPIELTHEQATAIALLVSGNYADAAIREAEKFVSEQSGEGTGDQVR